MSGVSRPCRQFVRACKIKNHVKHNGMYTASRSTHQYYYCATNRTHREITVHTLNGCYVSTCIECMQQQQHTFRRHRCYWPLPPSAAAPAMATCLHTVTALYRGVFVCLYIVIHDHGMVVYIPNVTYRLGGKFTESGKTRLHQVQKERKKLTGFENFSLSIQS